MTERVYFKNQSATATLAVWDGQAATLTDVFSTSRGRGHATLLMEEIVAYADTFGLEILLLVEPFHYSDNQSPNAEGLGRFYSKFGFEKIERNHMVRPSRVLHAS